MNDLFNVTGKVVLITGGTRGVGLMMAKGLVMAGARVYISSRDRNAVEKAAAELALWGECETLVGDPGTEAGCRALAAELTTREPRIHALINNAGVTLGASISEFGDAQWDPVWSVNVKGVFYMIRFLQAQLESAAGPGDPSRIINVGSVDGLKTPPLENYSYAASKAAVHHLTRHVARRLAPKITVNAIALGPFESEMTEAELGREIALRAPLRRMGSPEDVTGIVIFLLSRAGAFVTGSIMPVDGGLVTTT